MSGKKMLTWICSLSFIGGYTDVYGYLTVAFSLSHFTGSVARMAMDTHFNMFFWKLIISLTLFVMGNAVSGYVIGNRQFSFKKRYGLVLISLGSALAATFYITNIGNLFIFMLAFAMGVQNGLFITYKGVLVRTSHITGTLSDLGVYIGYLIKGITFDHWKMFYYFISIFSFFVGGFVSKVMFGILHKESIYLICISYIIIGVIYLADRKHLGELFLLCKEKFWD